MLNFREELNKIKESASMEWSIEEYADFFLTGLLAAVKQHTFSVKAFCCDYFVFLHRQDQICVKLSENRVADLFSITVKNSPQIFECILNKFKEDGFKVSVESISQFTVFLV